jgi:hypothetical protein
MEEGGLGITDGGLFTVHSSPQGRTSFRIATIRGEEMDGEPLPLASKDGNDIFG